MERKISKKEIRQSILARRSQMKPHQRRHASAVIAEKVLSSEWFQEAEDFYCYMDFRGEVSTGQMMKEAWHLGKKVWLPRVEGEEMEFYRVDSFEELSPGAFGILEPKPVQKTECHKGLMILPGAAFDKKRNRIGYGKGYYDRYLKKHPGIHTMAIAFDLQIIDIEIPAEPTDIKPDKIVTETAWY